MKGLVHPEPHALMVHAVAAVDSVAIHRISVEQIAFPTAMQKHNVVNMLLLGKRSVH